MVIRLPDPTISGETVRTIAQVLKQATQPLTNRTALPRLEAELLLAFVLDTPRSHLFAWPEQCLNPDQLKRFQLLLARRLRGEPAAYLTGSKEFWSLELKVTPATLIPRPETEQLVERALQRTPSDRPFSVADLGTGSGAIAAAIASERPLSAVIATDSSSPALIVARQNFRKHGLRNIRCILGSWCEALPRHRKFDLIVSNPPYVATGDPHLQADGLPWEPANALTAGKDGLDDIRRIVKTAHPHLNPEGWLLLEHGFDQGSAVRGLLQQAGYQRICTLRDLEGRERISEASTP